MGAIGSVVYLLQKLTLAGLDLITGTVAKLVGPDATDIYPYGFWRAPFVSGDHIVQIGRDCLGEA